MKRWMSRFNQSWKELTVSSNIKLTMSVQINKTSNDVYFHMSGRIDTCDHPSMFSSTKEHIY